MAGVRILLVDDDESLLYFVETLLAEQTCHEIEATVDPLDALARVRTRPPYRLVVTDIRMPGMSGLELAREIERIAPDTDIILISGDTRHLPGDFAGRPFLAKPFEIASLLAAIELEVSRRPV